GLRVEAELAVEEREVELVAVVIVLGDPALVRAHVAVEPRLDEAPEGGEGMPVGKEAPQIERGEHASLEVDVAVQVGLGDARLVERAEGAPRSLRAETKGESGRRGRGAHAMAFTVGFREIESGAAGPVTCARRRWTAYGTRFGPGIAQTLDEGQQGVKIVDPSSLAALLSSRRPHFRGASHERSSCTVRGAAVRTPSPPASAPPPR